MALYGLFYYITLHYIYKESHNYNDWIKYKKVTNKAIKEYKKAKKMFEKKLVKDIKKAFYSYVRSKSLNLVIRIKLVQSLIVMVG